MSNYVAIFLVFGSLQIACSGSQSSVSSTSSQTEITSIKARICSRSLQLIKNYKPGLDIINNPRARLDTLCLSNRLESVVVGSAPSFDIVKMNDTVQIKLNGMCLTETGYQQRAKLEPCTEEKVPFQTFRWSLGIGNDPAMGKGDDPGYIKPLNWDTCLDIPKGGIYSSFGKGVIFYWCKSGGVHNMASHNQQWYILKD